MTKTASPKFWHDFGITPSEAPENPGNKKKDKTTKKNKNYEH